MKAAQNGDELIPEGDYVINREFHYDKDMARLLVKLSSNRTLQIEARGILSFRFTESDSYAGYIEGSLDRVLTIDPPAWPIRYADEEGHRGDFVRKRKFYHINLSDVGILECYATSVSYGYV